MIKVLNLSTTDWGGAGYAAVRLHKHLRAAGVDSRMLVLHSKGNPAPFVSKVEVSAGSRARVFGGRFLTRYLYDYDRYFPVGTADSFDAICGVLDADGFTPDIILCHWTSRFVTPGDIRSLSERYHAPVLLHLLDMEPYTGGCHYSLGCLGYQGECGNCPALRPRSQHDTSNRQMREKLAHLRAIPMSAVATCDYVLQQTRTSSLLHDRIVDKVFYGIDPDVFKPGDRTAARTALGLPLDRRVVFTGSLDPRNRRKGTSYLVESLQLLSKADLKHPVTVAIAGSAKTFEPPADTEMLQFKWLGYLDVDTTLISAYQAADVFLCPSIEDAGPMMTSEAIMCGTPVVGFEMGVAFDLVHNGRTGYRARLADAEDLTSGIRAIVDMERPALDRMSAECRALGLELLHPDVQVQSFTRIFDRMLAPAITPTQVTA